MFKICTNIHHMVLNYQHKRNFDFILKSCQYFCLKLRYGHYKKINLQFYLLTLSVLFLWINMRDINSLTIIRIWLLHSFIKSSCFPYAVVRLWTVGKKLPLRTLHNICYGHYTVKHSFQRQGLVNFFVYLWTPGNYIRL